MWAFEDRGVFCSGSLSILAYTHLLYVSFEDVLGYFLSVREQDDVPGSCINSCLDQDVYVKDFFAFRTLRDALEEG